MQTTDAILDAAVFGEEVDPNDGEALYDSGEKHLFRREYELAYKCYKRAAELGHTSALAQFGMCYILGLGVEQDLDEGGRYIREAYEKGDAWGRYNLGSIYFYGDGVPIDYDTAFRLFYGCDADKVPGTHLMLGICYYHGYGTSRSYDRAFDSFVKADEAAKAKNVLNTELEFYLGICYLNGHGTDIDEDEAFRRLKSAAASGYYAYAQHYLALCYFKGVGTEPDESKAFEHMKKAAELDYLNSQTMLGLFYLYGYGTEVNNEEGFKWIEKAAKHENYGAVGELAEAQRILGALYDDGIGVEKSDRDAAVWLEKAANNGDAMAQALIAEFYEHGKVFLRNQETADYWYSKAAENGYEVPGKKAGGLETENLLKEVLKQFEHFDARFDEQRDISLDTMRIEAEHFALSKGIDRKTDSVAEGVGELSEKSDRANKRLDEINEKTDYVTASVDEISEKSDKANKKLDEISEKTDYMMGDIDEIKGSLNTVSGFQSELEKEMKELKEELDSAFMEKMTGFINDRLSNQNKTAAEEKLKKHFGSDWDSKLEQNVRTSLVSSWAMFEMYRNVGEDFDYRGVIMSATCALEGMLKNMMTVGLKNFADKYLGSFNIFNSTLSGNEKQMFRQHLDYLNTTNHTLGAFYHFCIGDIEYYDETNDRRFEFNAKEKPCFEQLREKYLESIIDKGFKNSCKYKDKAKNNVRVGLSSYTDCFSKAIFPPFKEITAEKRGDCMEDSLVAKIEYIKNTYRNRSAHSEIITREDAETCCELIYGSPEKIKPEDYTPVSILEQMLTMLKDKQPLPASKENQL